jgi:hypothetical protein
LNQPLAETLFADEQGAMQILHGAGHHFRRRRGFPVNQNDQRHGFGPGVLRTIDLHAVAPFAVPHRDDLQPLRQKSLGHLHGLLEQPARIVAQIKHERRHSLRLEFVERTPQFLARFLVEPARQPDVAHVGPQ